MDVQTLKNQRCGWCNSSLRQRRQSEHLQLPGNKDRAADKTLLPAPAVRSGPQYRDRALPQSGIGLPQGTHRGVGMFSMRERAAELGGTFAIHSIASGVHVSARLPCEVSSDEP